MYKTDTSTLGIIIYEIYNIIKLINYKFYVCVIYLTNNTNILILV